MRSSTSLGLNGNFYINGFKEKSIKSMKHRFSYVMQEDVMYDDLTPHELLLSTAKLAGIENPVARTDEIITMLGLDNCKNTRVGNVLSRGVSGGERKRTSIALELLTDPSVIFLDEPTTGLDSKSALDVAAIIKMLAENGRTIITTIHQPSSEIMLRFDRVMCLCEGKIVYDGPPSGMVKYFDEVGLPAPPLTNPTDHMLSILNDDDIKINAFKQGKDLSKEEVLKIFEKRLEVLVNHYNGHKPTLQKTKSTEQEYKDLLKPPVRPGTCYQAGLVLGRCFKYFFRNPKVFITKLFQMVIFALIAITLHNDSRNPEIDTVGAISDVNGVVFNITGTVGFTGIFGSVLGILDLI